MVPDKIFIVIRICIPVFALIGMGKLLSVKGVMTESHRDFLNRIAFSFALPALIFLTLSQQRFRQIINPALIVGTLSAIACIVILFSIICFIAGFKHGFAAAFIFGTFWGNTSYMGFPLASSAFGQERGLALAAVVNGFSMPIFVFLAFFIIGFFDRRKDETIVKKIIEAVFNPIICSIFLGIICALVSEIFIYNREINAIPLWIPEIARIIKALLGMVGTMGLPLALIALGGALKLKSITNNIVPLCAVVSAKLILLPLITVLIIGWLFPHAEEDVRGVAVLLMAMPSAVASFVIAQKLHCAEDFVSALLVVSTMLSIFTVPLWLYFLI